MADIGFRYARADLLKAVADRRGLSVSSLLRSLADSAVASEGFPLDEQQWALVVGGEIVAVSFKPAKDDRGGEWLPVENDDNRPFDAAKHWRMKPLPLRIDGERVVRVYPVIDKCMDHA